MNEQLLKEYKDLVIYKEYFVSHGTTGYVANVKLHHAFDFDKDKIKEHYYLYLNKNRERDLFDERLDDLSDTQIDNIFWDQVIYRVEDALGLIAYNKEEYDHITEETICTGRSGGYLGFKYYPADIIENYENEDMDDAKLREEIAKIKQMNTILGHWEAEAKGMSVNEEIIQYIECAGWLDEIRNKVEREEKLASIKQENSFEIATYTKQLEDMGLKVELTLK